MQRGYYFLCLAVGRTLRAARYAKVRIAHDGAAHVRKHRVFYAPFLLRLGRALFQVLDTGVRVLPQWEWEERERALYPRLYGRPIGIEGRGVLVLPRLAGETLAALLANGELDESAREQAIDMAVVALAEFHHMGFTHGDAMAENVMIDFETGAARWFDFETEHDARRSMAWRRADDLRALLATCVLRIAPEKLAETVCRILDTYADEEVARLAATSFTSVPWRSLAFHLGQAGLSLEYFRAIDRVTRARMEQQLSPAR